MSWIDEFAKGSYSLYAGNTIDAFQPLDFFHFYGIWYDLWLTRVIEALEKLGAENKSYSDLKDIIPTPSSLRALIQKAIPAYIGSSRQNKELYRRYTNFLARMLAEACPADPFGLMSTPLHTPEQLKAVMDSQSWLLASPVEARMIGKLITSAGSLVHGLYNDVVTDFAWDAYGPYANQAKDNQKYTLLIRNFPDLRPADLWANDFLPHIKSLQIYQLFQDVTWEIACVGCHTLLKDGNPMTGLKYFAIVSEGKPLPMPEINNLILELAEKAEKIYREIRKKDFEQIKQMVMLQECYQFKILFEAAGMDWKSTPAMLSATKDKPLLTDILPHGVMMTSLDEYKKVFHLLEFEQEVLK